MYCDSLLLPLFTRWRPICVDGYSCSYSLCLTLCSVLLGALTTFHFSVAVLVSIWFIATFSYHNTASVNILVTGIVWYCLVLQTWNSFWIAWFSELVWGHLQSQDSFRGFPEVKTIFIIRLEYCLLLSLPFSHKYSFGSSAQLRDSVLSKWLLHIVTKLICN